MNELSTKRWTMIADLERCVGCQTCTAACKHANATSPAVQWRRVLDIESGTYPDVRRTFVPVGCMHCSDPPCMHVCPSTATGQRDDGIVTIDYDLCIGCAYCAVACPYQARYKVQRPTFAYGGVYGDKMKNEAEREDPARLGVAQKCTWCSDRIDFGLENDLTPGIDPRATPACVNACIADALHFGDANNPESNVSKMLAGSKTFKMHAELGTDPNFHYVYGDNDSSEANSGDMVKTVNNSADLGVKPWLQQHWDWRAAGNFIGGGTGGGLAVMGALAAALGATPGALQLAAMASVALGLFMVFLETGRPLRAPLNVLFHPQTSWMTREAMIGIVFFPVAFAALWMGSRELAIVAGLLGLAFVFTQGRILTEAKGIPAWRNAAMLPLILSTGLAEGAGLTLAATAVFPIVFGGFQMVSLWAVLALAVLRVAAWMNYRNQLAGNAPEMTLRVLGGVNPAMIVVGHLLPIGLAGAAMAFPVHAPLSAFLAGISVAVTGWAMKYIIVVKASYNQGYAIEKVPARGISGIAAGVQPGWK
ncbi:MAG: 4Fe-4S dicluster domain-containing protein [Rhodospirillaceae bacterium]|nr:4Fe-4S dicluster domain-containing protein [Rhodospirillaceae bacterium]